jgi:hypothetical protein
MKNFKWCRKWLGGNWYKHENTFQLQCLYFDYFWVRYGEINRYTKVVEVERWQ